MRLKSLVIGTMADYRDDQNGAQTKRCRPSSKSFSWLLAILVLLVGLLTACGPAEPEAITLGMINLLSDLDTAIEGFKVGMDERVDDEQVIAYLYPGATGNPATLQSAAQDLVDADVNLIFCVTTPACLAAQRVAAEEDVPVVFSAVTDPAAAGLVESLTTPGGNVTGVTVGAKNAVNEGRRLEWLLQAVPSVERVYIPYNPDDAAVAVGLAAVQDVASKLEVELVLAEARTAEQVDAALDAIPQDVDAIFVFADQVVVADVTALVDVALEQELPLSTPNSLGPALGALMSYGSDLYASGQQAARLADQILRGTDPADLPVETPEFFLTINLATADAIGLDISNEILRQADTIIR